MSDPLTTEDLYGKSKPEGTLPIEETPEILVEPEHVPSSGPSIPVNPPPPQALPPVGMLPKRKPNSFIKTIGTVVVFLALFVVGIWLSSFLRQFLSSDPSTTNETPLSKTNTPTPTTSSVNTPSRDPYALWKTYDVISGITKKPVIGVQFKLPPDVLAPVCDGSACASQGTYLSGGTRFTVAARGVGQSLRDFRGTIISDVNGKAFETRTMTVAGMPAVEFTGSFAGRTISGYVFSKMRGVMIELSDTTSLEVNHFTPNGITSDFEKDELVFDEILKNIMVSGDQKGAVIIPTRAASGAATLAPTKTPTATSSGN